MTASRVTVAVIPAAGLGTRLLPATKSQPKEMLPVIDKPAIQYAVEEAVRAGIDDVLIVSGRGRATLEDHFDRSPELERRLHAADKTDDLEQVRRIAELADVHYVRQKEPLGFGHAVLCARSHVGERSFAVLVPDEIVPAPGQGELELLVGMIRAHGASGASVLAVQRHDLDSISAYGVVDPAEDGSTDLVRIKGMVEKPPPGRAPSDLAARGRYVFDPAIFDALDKTAGGVGGEIQLTDAINVLAQEREVLAYIYRGPIFDVGKKLGYVQTAVELALERDDLAGPLKEWLRELVARFDP